MIESKYLKDSVQNIQKLMNIAPLRKFETKYLGQLIRLSKIREYAPGEPIIKEGGQDTWIYFPWDMGFTYQEPIAKGHQG